MISWKLGRWILYLTLAAVIVFNFGLASVMDWSLQTEILSGITVQTVIGIAAVFGIWLIKKLA